MLLSRSTLARDQDRNTKSSFFDINPCDRYIEYYFFKNTNGITLCLCNCDHLHNEPISASFFMSTNGWNSPSF